MTAKGASGAAGSSKEPVLRPWGYAVRVREPDQHPRARIELWDPSEDGQWVSPDGLSPVPFYWTRRSAAQAIVAEQLAQGRQVAVTQAGRLRSCTSPALNPWDEGFDPKRDRELCGNTLINTDVTLRWIEEIRVKRERAEERLRRTLAREDARAKREAAREAQLALREAKQGSVETLARALVLLRRSGEVRQPAEERAQATIIREIPGAREELYFEGPDGQRELNVDWLRDQMCLLADDSARTDPRVSKRLLKILPGECTRAEARLAAHEAERKRRAKNAQKKPRASSKPRKPREPRAPRGAVEVKE